MPTRIAAEEINQTYDVYIHGLRVGEMVLSAHVDDTRYAAKGSVSDDGVTSIFFDYEYVGHVAGNTTATGGLTPVEYRSREVEDSETTRKVEIGFDAEAPVAVSLDPKPKPRKFDVDPAEMTGTLDPLTGIIALLRDRPAGSPPCGRSVDLFDGRRVSRISLAQTGQNAGRIVCEGNFTRVAGFSKKKLRKRTKFPISLYLRPAGDGGARVESLTAMTKFGTVTAIRR